MLEELVGKSVMVRTVTHYHVGRLEAVSGGFMKLTSAIWVADTGSWSRCLVDGVIAEYDIFPDRCYINVGSVVDIAPWDHPIPRDRKG